MNANNNNHTNGTKSSELSFDEAPASWNTRYLDPNDFECQITLRGETGSELLERAFSAIAYLLKNGCIPYVYRSTSRTAESKNGNDQVIFHTGWFVESVLSAGIVVFAIRTRLPFVRSKPSKAMLGMTLLIAVITLTLPFTPLAELLGFAPLPLNYLLSIFGIIALYFLSAELVKHWFYKSFGEQQKFGVS